MSQKIEFIKNNATQIGMTSGFGAWLTKFIETSTPTIQFIALCLGCTVAFLSALIKLKVVIEKYSKKKNETREPME